ncbi:MAG: phage tail protein [Janthinobacterium lividum]
MDAFLGEIRLMSFEFAPKGWAYCQGQLLAVQQNQALFSLLGTTFGGNGQTTFALPDLRGRAIVGQGQLTGGSTYVPGQARGTESVALTQDQIPAHTHTFSGTVQAGADALDNPPAGAYPGDSGDPQYASGTANGALNQATLAGGTLAPVGGQPHENRMPTLVLNYAIAIQGYFPSRQ